ncbi:endonuclease domain-containing protein [Roseitalea porphyridii]|uniref:endonuclease domain-containing protein n=1 Tax=Roseitalea porphyridii TaxID=1852022 RepID=UPI0035B502F6
MPHRRVPAPNRSNARRMRRGMTDAERKLWRELRAHRLMGLGFRRQMPISGFIVDFACPEYRLIIELDGSQHGLPTATLRDRTRDARLDALGWQVLRFWNDDVLGDVDGVCRHIVAAIDESRRV